MSVSHPRIILGLCCLVCTACIGNSPAQLALDNAPGAGAAAAASSAHLRRLTQVEYQNSITDLLGTDVAWKVSIDADPSQPGVFSTVTAAVTSSTSQDVAMYDTAAQGLAAQRFADPQAAAAFMGCTPTLDANDACAQSFLRQFGGRVLRRPLTPAEMQRYSAAYGAFAQSGNSVWSAPQAVTAAFLESPKFLYRAEVAANPNAAGVQPVDAYTLASRLSYLLLSSTPDAALLQAAAAGDLDTAAGVAAQAKRLLALPQAHAGINRYFAEWLNYTYMDGLNKDPNLFPAMSPTLGASMRGEFDRVVESLVFTQSADISQLLTTQDTFLNGELAALYGVPGITGSNFVPYTFAASSPRAGLLTMAGYLAIQSPATRTSPTHRGLFIREALLCQNLPGPPANVPPFQEVPPAGGPQTMRQRLTEHKSSASCAACHTLMDPLGFALEHFDGMGVYRGTDQGLTLDTTGTLDAATFADARGLGQQVQARADLGACITRQVYTYALGQVPSATQAAGLAALSQGFDQGGKNFQSLLLELVQSDAFRLVSAAGGAN